MARWVGSLFTCLLLIAITFSVHPHPAALADDEDAKQEDGLRMSCISLQTWLQWIFGHAHIFSSRYTFHKLIGAKLFFAGYESAHNDTANITQSSRDYEGHGTHTASTIGGARVDDVSFFGLASGTAVGGAPSARIASYKVCWDDGCNDADIMAAFDEAIKDGVDILSVSLGGSFPQPLYEDGTAIASFHATSKGILVSNSAGNDGPGLGTVTSCAPWILTVGASTIDREFKSTVELGDGTTVQGVAVNRHATFAEEVKEIVDAAAIPAAGVAPEVARLCGSGSLDSSVAIDKVVICEQPAEYAVDKAVAEAGGYGFITVNNSFTAKVFPFDMLYSFFRYDIAGSWVDEAQAETIMAYISNSGSSPTATIKQSETVLIAEHSPVIASFSSRGPNLVSPYILKPDVTAPGVSILAAYTEFVKPGSNRGPPKYVIISGTSMSCPHVSGAAALVKSLHPTWSPAAIKSALMTTATPLSTGNILDFGAGHINIVKAVDPGLIYDLTEADYHEFLCSGNFTAEQYSSITGGGNISTCPAVIPSPSNLNYPTITVDADSIITRTVTNVGEAASTYIVSVVEPPGTSITVEPTELVFTQVDEKLQYTVSIQIVDPTKVPISGGLIWSDGARTVTSVIFMSDFTFTG